MKTGGVLCYQMAQWTARLLYTHSALSQCTALGGVMPARQKGINNLLEAP